VESPESSKLLFFWLQDGVSITVGAEGATEIWAGDARLRLEPRDASERSKTVRFLAQLKKGVRLERLVGSRQSGKSSPSSADLLLLFRLREAGLLAMTLLHLNGRRVASFLPFPGVVGVERVSMTLDAEVTLSRFAYLRRSTEPDMPRLPHGWVLESPAASARVLLHSRAGEDLVLALCSPRRPSALANERLPLPVVALFLSLLGDSGFLWAPAAREPRRGFKRRVRTNAERMYWSFHDLLFHARTRRRRNVGEYGRRKKIDRADDSECSPPFSFVRLPAPASLPPESLQALLLRRRSVRQAAATINIEDLSTLLYVGLRGPSPPHIGKSGGRPYPSAGGCYPLEFYVNVARCNGLEPGLYWYDQAAHILVRRSVREHGRGQLLAQCASACGLDPGDTAQVVLHFTARLERISTHYNSVAYSAVLKEVGAVFQTLYLVAAALRISACALGGGDADLFSDVTSIDYYYEPCVAEFWLGGTP
jgi:oxazoline/thiazoline dehydrogenase